MNGADSEPAGESPESVLCDTSFVSIVQSAGRNEAIIAAWPEDVQQRLDHAILAISVITLAELRDGHIYGRWGEARRQRAEQLIGAYVLIPLDMTIVNRFAETRATCRSEGITVPDNDIWIAATAYTRGWPLVSCDGHFDLIPDCDHIRLPIAQ